MHLSARTGRIGALVAACLTVATLAVPAGAVGTFRAPVRVTGTNCMSVFIAAGGGSTQHGFAACDGNGITYVEGDGTRAWKQVHTSLKGTVVGVADDGTRTYLLYQPSSTKLVLAIRTRGGTITRQTIFTGKVNTHFLGSIVARNGKWWAEWIDDNGGSTAVWQAHTLKSVQKATRTKLFAMEVQLALRGSSVVLAWSPPNRLGIQVGFPTGAAGWTHSTVTPRFSTEQQLLMDGKRVAVAYVTTDAARHGQVYWAVRASDGRWVTKRLTSGSHADPIYLFGESSRGTVVLAWQSSLTATTVEVRRGGTWSHRTLPTANAFVQAAALRNGRALIVYSTPLKRYAESRLEN